MFLADDHGHPLRAALIPPLQEIVKDEGMWACHLGPELGGPGYGQMKLALLNYILGRSRCASKVFGTAAPDTGNSEILAHYGTPQQKQQYLAPLLDDQIASSYSMTEPTAGADPKQFKCMAELDELNQEWVINGEKWFSSNAKYASILLVMAVSDPDAPNPYQRASMFIVPKDTPGVEIVRNVGVSFEHFEHEPERGEDMEGGSHGYIRYTDVRIPADHLLGHRGGGFVVAQTRLSGGRIHCTMMRLARFG